MSGLLIDTDVFVDHIRGARSLDAKVGAASFSVVTRCELFAGPAEQEHDVRALLAPLKELSVDGAIAERAGQIRRETGIHTTDALIAATALEHGLTLMTRNRRHFEHVPKLRLR